MNTPFCSFEGPTRLSSEKAAITLWVVMALALMAVAIPAAQAQTFTAIHEFTGGGDGAQPETGLTMGAAGNLYGTTPFGGSNGLGTVFKLKYSGSDWILTPLYSFAGGSGDGASPFGRVAIAQDGTLYGTSFARAGGGCGGNGCGAVFHLTPSPVAPRTALTPWRETILHRFTGGIDGGNPIGDLIFDQSGNIYGTTNDGGSRNDGVIYKLTPSGGSWTETTLYSAQGTPDGSWPVSGVVSDRFGNLYGVFFYGGPYGYGAVFELSPSGSGWTEQIIYGFAGGSDGANPAGGLIIDAVGNLYGTTTSGGSGVGGTVFELTPTSGSWRFSTLYSFPGSYSGGSEDKLVMDTAGNLYGTTYQDGAYGWGSVFKLTPSSGGWTYSSLHDFCAAGPYCPDGANPVSSLVLDANGNLYGTTSLGGSYGYGVAFEITP